MGLKEKASQYQLRSARMTGSSFVPGVLCPVVLTRREARRRSLSKVLSLNAST